MKVIIQRVTKASVTVQPNPPESIGKGLALLVGFEKGDQEEFLPAMIQKLLNLRIFDDGSGKMNLSIRDIQGSILAVPNFTLAAKLNGGNRPSFDAALPPNPAKELFDQFIQQLKEKYPNVLAGTFGANMQVLINNDGPVTFSLSYSSSDSGFSSE